MELLDEEQPFVHSRKLRGPSIRKFNRQCMKRNPNTIDDQHLNSMMSNHKPMVGIKDRYLNMPTC